MSVKDIEMKIVDNWNNGIDCPVTKLLRKEGWKGTAEHIGSTQYPPTTEWGQYNKQKSYAKTDIKIGNNKVSLKTTNDHIMLSAKKNEALATFMCVADSLYGNKIPSLLKDVTDDMEMMVTKGVSPLTIVKARKSGSEVITNADKRHKMIIDSMEKMFENDPTFHAYFVREVLSGELKFGTGSDASATHIIVMGNKPILHSLDDMDFIGKVAGTVDIRVDFKSVKKWMGKEAGQYRYWSVLQMISKELIKDSIMYEEALLHRSISYILSLLSNIRQSIISWEEVFSFLGVEPDVTISIK